MKILLPILLASCSLLRAEDLLVEDFAADPVASGAALVSGDASRFVHTAGELTAAYDLLLPHSRMAWPLSSPLTEADSFTAHIEFELEDVDFDDFNLCQLSFGFINQANTGTRRTESPGDCWEMLSIDYFPGASFPSWTPTFVRQEPIGGADPLSGTYLKFPAGSASLINDFGEIEYLPESTTLTATLSYDAATQVITTSLADADGGLAINAFGSNTDNDESTIQLQLTDNFPFEFDAFALLLWDHFQGGSANLTLRSIRVSTPELDLLATAFPNGLPDPVFNGGQLQLNFTRDLSQSGFTISAEHSLDLRQWAPVTSSVLSAGPGFEIHQVSVDEGFLRLRVDAN